MNRYPASLLEHRFDYESWRNKTNLETNLLIWNFSLAGTELPGWQPQEIRGRKPALPAMTGLAHPPDREFIQPQAEVQSIWQPDQEQDDLRIGVDVLECRSREEAHQLLLSLLGELQSPLVRRLESPVVGDVAFAVPGETLVIYARGNLVALIRNVGRTVSSVLDVAQQLDKKLASVPTGPGRQVANQSQILRLESEQLAAEGTTRLELSDLPPAAEPPMMKFLSRSGQVVLEDGQPTYKPESSGSQEIEVYIEQPGGKPHGQDDSERA